MTIDVSVRVSNRHVHLTKEVYDMLFDEEMNVKKHLNQVGEFASDKTLTIKNGDNEINNVRVCGPFRQYNQVELSKLDARLLGLNPPVRHSGDLEDALSIVLKTDKGCVTVKGAIIAKRHVHMTMEDASKYGVKNKQKVQLLIENEKGGLMDAEITISDNAYFEAHIDTDDANCMLVNDNEKAKMII